MSFTDLSPDDVERLVRLLEANDLSELRYESNGVVVMLRAGGSVGPSSQRFAAAAPVPRGRADAVSVAAPASPTAATTAEVPDGGASRSDDLFDIESPIAGTFYRAASPGEPPLVDVGDVVEEGQAIGLIEAMKVFSEVLSERAGTITRIVAKDTTAVAQGAILLTLDTTRTTPPATTPPGEG